MGPTGFQSLRVRITQRETTTDNIFSSRTRPGERVAKRRRAKASIGAGHKIHQSETMKWFKNRFDGIIR